MACDYVEGKHSPPSIVDKVDALTKTESDNTYTVSEEDINRITTILNGNGMQSGEQVGYPSIS